ncbi:MAG: hypothetical protein RLZZ488_1827 [Pseudomonadota bacterium]
MSARLTVARVAFALVAIVVSACGQADKPQESETQGWLPWVNDEPVKIFKTESGDDIPERVAKFLDTAEQFGRGVHTYRLGSYTRSVTDCSGFLGQAHRSAGHRVAVFQFDWDFVNFDGCKGQLRAGDVLLLAYPGRQPDHWVMVADVRDPNGKFNSADNIIMDVSSDYVDGKPFYKGPLSRRRNLLARNVYACRRHRTFERDWKQMMVQIKEQQSRPVQSDPDATPDNFELPVTKPEPQPQARPNSVGTSM